MAYLGSLRIFWESLSLIEPWMECEARSLRTKDIWWRKETVDWLEPSRYSVLIPDADLLRLGQLKSEFLETLAAVSDDSAAAKALVAIREIYRILSPLIESIDHVKFGKALSGLLHKPGNPSAS